MPNLPFFLFLLSFFFFFPSLGLMDMDLLYFISVCLFAVKNCRSNTRECLHMVLTSFVCIQRGLVTVTSAGSRATRKYQSMETGVCHPPSQLNKDWVADRGTESCFQNTVWWNRCSTATAHLDHSSLLRSCYDSQDHWRGQWSGAICSTSAKG